MGTAEHAWRWRDAGLAALIWFVPITGLREGSITIDRVLSSLLIGLLVGTVMSVPLPSLHAQVVKTATAKRIAEGIWTAATGAAAIALLGLGDRSFFSATIGLACLWVVISLSVGFGPLAIARTGLGRDGIAWMPVPRRSRVASMGKRAFDVTVAVAAMFAIAPLMLVTAMAIKANDGGPVLFKQRRIGRNGVPFEMYKFRSMVLNAEELKADLEASSERSGPLFKMSDDPRITSIGRIIRDLSIDELPQLINIVRGDMSLVGPRPALPDEAAQFDDTLQRRNAVTPGLTGLWQAEARSDADFERFRDLDLRYVSTASPALDFWIILATATDVIVAAAAAPLAAAGFDVGRADAIDLRTESDVIDLRTPVDSSSPRPSAA